MSDLLGETCAFACDVVDLKGSVASTGLAPPASVLTRERLDGVEGLLDPVTRRSFFRILTRDFLLFLGAAAASSQVPRSAAASSHGADSSFLICGLNMICEDGISSVSCCINATSPVASPNVEVEIVRPL